MDKWVMYIKCKKKNTKCITKYVFQKLLLTAVVSSSVFSKVSILPNLLQDGQRKVFELSIAEMSSSLMPKHSGWNQSKQRSHPTYVLQIKEISFYSNSKQ